jgi:hypothetical protein
VSKEDADFSRLDDPEFLAERARVRERLEHLPTDHADYGQLAVHYRAMNDEFCRRASIAWTQAG